MPGGNIKTPAQGAANYTRGTSTAQTTWNNMCQQYSGNPMQMAAAQQAKALLRVTQAFSPDGNWTTTMQEGTQQQWKNGVSTAAKNNKYTTGCQAGQANFQKFLQNAQYTYVAMRDAARQDPNATPAQKYAYAIAILIAAGRNGQNILRARGRAS